MGNRAVITTKGYDDNTTGIYLHWNGGRDSIEGFLAYAKLKGYRNPIADPYGMARLTQVIANFFTSENECTCSVGVGPVGTLDCDNWDNGMYIIDGDWNIVGREYMKGEEQCEHDLLGMMVAIDEHMPVVTQVGEEAIREWIANNTE